MTHDVGVNSRGRTIYCDPVGSHVVDGVTTLVSDSSVIDYVFIAWHLYRCLQNLYGQNIKTEY